MIARLVFSVALSLLVLTTGCGIPEIVGGGIALHRAHELKKDREAIAAGYPRPWLEHINDVRKRGERLGTYWKDGWIGEKSKPYYDAYETIYFSSNRTVSTINTLNDKGLVTKEDMQKFDLYQQPNALRWLIARYKAVALQECVEAQSEAQTAANNGINQHGEALAATAYRNLRDVVQAIPSEPRSSSLHYARIVGLSEQ